MFFERATDCWRELVQVMSLERAGFQIVACAPFFSICRRRRHNADTDSILEFASWASTLHLRRPLQIICSINNNNNNNNNNSILFYIVAPCVQGGV
jgi:hypothetical protein